MPTPFPPRLPRLRYHAAYALFVTSLSLLAGCGGEDSDPEPDSRSHVESVMEVTQVVQVAQVAQVAPASSGSAFDVTNALQAQDSTTTMQINGVSSGPGLVAHTLGITQPAPAIYTAKYSGSGALCQRIHRQRRQPGNDGPAMADAGTGSESCTEPRRCTVAKLLQPLARP